MKLPIHYNDISWRDRWKVRKEYIRLQNNKCYHCKESLDGPPEQSISNLSIKKYLFPDNFFDTPIHLHHDHNTGMTLGVIHAYCNAVLWQYYGE